MSVPLGPKEKVCRALLLYREHRNRAAPGVHGEEELVVGVVGERTLRGKMVGGRAHGDTAKTARRHDGILGESAVAMLGEHYDLVAVRVVTVNEDGRSPLPDSWMRRETRRAVGRGHADWPEN